MLLPLRAEDGTQTRDPQLGRLMLYQLSYFRNLLCDFDISDLGLWIHILYPKPEIINR